MNIDFKKTSHIAFFAAILPAFSLGLSWSFYQIFPNFPFWVETLSPLLAYGLLYSLFEKSAWHWGIFKVSGVVSFPDLRGRWRGEQRSSYKENGNSAEVPAYLEISQSFSKICVRAFYEKSQSESWVASFTEINGDEYLFYTYDNDPNSLKAGTMQNHKGTVKLKYLPKENKLLGIYFNSIGNHGEMLFDFEQKDNLYRFKK